MAEKFFRAKLDGGAPDPDDLAASFDQAWDTAAAGAAFGAAEDVDLLKRQAATRWLRSFAPYSDECAEDCA